MKLKQLIRDTYILRQQIELLTKQYEENRKQIQQSFDEHNLDKVEVESKVSGNSENLVAMKVERVQIDYKIDKLQEKLDKELFNEIVLKTYFINNIDGLIKLLKESGIKPEEFKKYIEAHMVLNKAKLKQLYSLGDITKQDLKGCYEAKIVKSIQIKPRGGTN